MQKKVVAPENYRDGVCSQTDEPSVTFGIKIDGDFEMRRAVTKEYVNKIIISDDGIEIQCIGDYNLSADVPRLH